MIERTYGWFPGGAYDPRRFEPDRAVNTSEEIATWERLCEAWEAGAGSVVFRPGLQPGGYFGDGSPLGMGTYEIEVDEDEPEPGAEEDIPPIVLSA